MELCVSGLFLGVGAFSDFKNRKIPYAVILPAMAAALILVGIRGCGMWDVLYRLLPAVFLWTLRILTKKGIGMGDVMAVLILSLLLGTASTLLILSGASLLSLCMTGILLLMGKKTSGEPIPFYPGLFCSWALYLCGAYAGILSGMDNLWVNVL